MAGNSDTTWIKKTVEGLQLDEEEDDEEVVKQTYAVAEYDTLVNIEKSADEAILMGTGTGSTASDAPPASGANYPTNQNFTSYSKAWRKGVESGPDFIDRIINAAALAIVAGCYGDTTAEEPQRATRIIKGQMYQLIGLLLSFIVIWNWWYLWNYTSFSFDFENLLNYPPFSILFYIFEPSFKVIELINYYMITRRIDAEISPAARGILRHMWDWRPVAFGLFTLVVMGGCLNIPFGAVFVDLFSGNPTGIAKLVIFLSILMYIYVTINPMRIRSFMSYFFWFPPILVFVILFLLLLVYLFSSFTAGMFAVYLLILSHFTLLLFTRLNPIGAILQIYDDLSTAPVKDPNPTSKIMELGNRLFQKFHWIILLSIFIAVFSNNMKDAGTLKNGLAILFIVFVLNFVFIVAFMPGIVLITEILYALWHAFREMLSNASEISSEIAARIVFRQAPVQVPKFGLLKTLTKFATNS